MKLILGTAMWAWTMPKRQCFEVLDAFYEKGGREVDTATNYPINKHPVDFRAAENILLDWINTHGIRDLKVMMKIGSLNNLGTPDHNLVPSFLLLSGREYQYKFKENFSTLMIHWDNREDLSAIQSSLDILQTFQKEGLRIGLSGIKHPQLYAEALKTVSIDGLRIQMKHNLLYSDFDRYAPLHDCASFIAYGINAGGLKLQANAYSGNASLLARGGRFDEYKNLIKQLNHLLKESKKHNTFPIPSRMNHLGLLNALYHPAIKQILLGVSSIGQLEDSWNWVQLLESENYQDFYSSLSDITKLTF